MSRWQSCCPCPHSNRASQWGCKGVRHQSQSEHLPCTAAHIASLGCPFLMEASAACEPLWSRQSARHDSPYSVDLPDAFLAPGDKIDFRDPFRFHALLLKKRPQKWARKSKLSLKVRFLFLYLFHFAKLSRSLSNRGTTTPSCVEPRTPSSPDMLLVAA